MPPKKRAAASDAPASQAKTRKTNASNKQSTAADEQAQRDESVEVTGEKEKESPDHSDDPRSSRTRNVPSRIDDETIAKAPYEYITQCVPASEFEARWRMDRAERGEDFGEQNPRELWAEEHKTKRCACYTNASDGWSLMRKAWAREIDTTTVEIPQRNPDAFDMYVYNDFQSYGYQEVFENHMSEFNKELNKRGGKTEELWTIVESLGYWIVDDRNGDLSVWGMGEDSPRIVMTSSLLGFMLLATLNRMDREGDLKADSKYKDLPLVLSFWIAVARTLTPEDAEDTFLDNSSDESEDDFDSDLIFNLFWVRYLLVLAEENNIPIEGVTGIDDQIDELQETVDGKVKLPKKAADRFGWKSKYSKYTKEYGRGGKIGGQAYMIPKWTRAERVKYAYDHKDPLSDEEIRKLKEGLVMQVA